MHFAYDSYAKNLEKFRPEGTAGGTDKVDKLMQERCQNIPTGEECVEISKTAKTTHDLTINN